jgi:hypothetical protein
MIRTFFVGFFVEFLTCLEITFVSLCILLFVIPVYPVIIQAEVLSINMLIHPSVILPITTMFI